MCPASLFPLVDVMGKELFLHGNKNSNLRVTLKRGISEQKQKLSSEQQESHVFDIGHLGWNDVFGVSVYKALEH